MVGPAGGGPGPEVRLVEVGLKTRFDRTPKVSAVFERILHRIYARRGDVLSCREQLSMLRPEGFQLQLRVRSSEKFSVLL